MLGYLVDIIKFYGLNIVTYITINSGAHAPILTPHLPHPPPVQAPHPTQLCE